jgi:hypothetical protein
VWNLALIRADPKTIPHPTHSWTHNNSPLTQIFGGNPDGGGDGIGGDGGDESAPINNALPSDPPLRVNNSIYLRLRREPRRRECVRGCV